MVSRDLYELKMSARLEISARLAGLGASSILTRWSESALESGVPDEAGLELRGVSITEISQFADLAAREEGLL